MKKLTSDQRKIDLVDKLVKDGAIDFSDALKLLEVEVEKEYITVPQYDWLRPINPYSPFNPPIYYNPTTSTDLEISSNQVVFTKDTKGVGTTANLLAYSN